MRTVDSKGKRALSKFLTQLCGVDVGDASCSEGQCEFLVGAIIVCLHLLLSLLLLVLLLLLSTSFHLSFYVGFFELSERR